MISNDQDSLYLGVSQYFRMLNDLQTKKLTHYFQLLDFDNNGTVEKDDFIAIAENLCILWGIKEGSPKYEKYTSMYEESWREFRNSVVHKDPEQSTLAEWLEFADRYIVNGTDEFFDRYMQRATREIFDTFDNNGDGFISLDEYIDLFMAYNIQVRYSAKSYIHLDLNSDDLLSRSEMLSAVDEFFRSPEVEAPGNWLFGFWGNREQPI